MKERVYQDVRTYVWKDQWEWLTVKAKEMGTKKAILLRQAIDKFIEEEDKKHKKKKGR